MKVVTLLNEKGGVGKTTLAVHLAAGLAVHGYRVVLVDADPQGNATVTLGLTPQPAIYDLLVRGARWNDTLRVIAPEVYERPDVPAEGLLAVLASNVETRSIANNTQDALGVRRRLKELETSVDFVIVDTSPTPSLLHGSIFLGTDYILYPTEVEYLSFMGLTSSIEHMEHFASEKESMNLGTIQTLGIVPMKYRGNTAGHQENLAQLKERYGAWVWTEMPMRIAWSDATVQRRTVWANEPDSQAAKDAWRFVRKAMEVLRVKAL